MFFPKVVRTFAPVDPWLFNLIVMIRKHLSLVALLLSMSVCAQESDYTLVWCDEFNEDGVLSTDHWSYEYGYVRNHEAQWYQRDNARVEGGCLVIEARREEGEHPYTSASVNTRGHHDWLYGRFEVRACIPTAGGAWPAIWTLGRSLPWPSCGEIDIMEYYRIDGVPHILANAAWGNDVRNSAVWSSRRIPFTHFTDADPHWADSFHVWRMDWDECYIRIFLDDELLNEVDLSRTANGRVGHGLNPFRQPHYLLLNLALGGDNGGDIDDSVMPLRYLIDYVRVYQRATSLP